MNISKPDQVVFSVVAVREEDPSQEEEESANKRTGVSKKILSERKQNG